jgi:hypothetical protein
MVNNRALGFLAFRAMAEWMPDRSTAYSPVYASITIVLPIIVLQAQSNRLADLKPLVPKVLEILDIAPKGQATFYSKYSL